MCPTKKLVQAELLTNDLPNIIKAINFLRSLRSIRIARAEKNPAIAALRLSSLENLLKMQSTPLYMAVIIAKKRPNLIESPFCLRLSL